MYSKKLQRTFNDGETRCKIIIKPEKDLAGLVFYDKTGALDFIPFYMNNFKALACSRLDYYKMQKSLTKRVRLRKNNELID